MAASCSAIVRRSEFLSYRDEESEMSSQSNDFDGRHLKFDPAFCYRAGAFVREPLQARINTTTASIGLSTTTIPWGIYEAGQTPWMGIHSHRKRYSNMDVHCRRRMKKVSGGQRTYRRPRASE
jgi:hypothetical protein